MDNRTCYCSRRNDGCSPRVIQELKLTKVVSTRTSDSAAHWQSAPGPPYKAILGVSRLAMVCSLIADWIRFHEWYKTYGDIVGLKFGSQNVIVLNSAKDINE